MSDHQGQTGQTGQTNQTGPDGRPLPPTPEPVADAAVYRDVTGRPIPLAAGWERPDGERPRANVHQQWAGAAASFGDDSGSLFAADTRQTRAEYRPPVSYPATAGGSAFFNGARQAANEQQAAQSGGLSMNSGPMNSGPTPQASPAPPAPQAPRPPATPSQTRLTLPEPVAPSPVPPPPPVRPVPPAPVAPERNRPEPFQPEPFQPEPYQAPFPPQPQPASYREREPGYLHTAPTGFEFPTDSRYDTFEDYQTGAQPVVQDWDQRDPYEAEETRRQDGYSQSDDWNQPAAREESGGWRQPDTGQNNRYQDDDRQDAPREQDDWRQPSARQDEQPRREDEYARDERYREQDRALGREPVRGQDNHRDRDEQVPDWQRVQGSQPLSGGGYSGPPSGDRGWPQDDSPNQSGGFAPEPFARSQDPRDGDQQGVVWGGQDEFGGRRLLGDPDNAPNYGAVPRHDRNQRLYGDGQAPREGRRGMSNRRKIALVVLVIAALAVGRFVSQLGSDKTGLSKLFLRDGSVGKPVELRYADITATTVEGSACMITPANSKPYRSPGVFVVVPLKIVVRGKTAALQYAAIEDSKGRTYGVASNGRGLFEPGSAQVGVPRYATVAIEMPKDAVPGARLQIGLNSLYLDQDDITDIDLGVTPAQADQWAKNKQAVFVPASSDQPPAKATSASDCEGPVSSG